VSIWDGGWADQPEAEREGDWCNGNPEPWRGEDSPPEEEFDDEAGDEWKPNHWPSAEPAGPEYKMFQKRQREGGGVKNGDDR
jgi:hypothetical protein